MPKSIKIDKFRYMTNESWRVLMAVEMGMKNHEFVPLDLVHKISRCARRSSAFLKFLRDDLVPHGLLAFETDSRKNYSGYRLTNLGYDYLALHALIKSGQVIDLGSMIGSGKESDVYLAVAGPMCGRRCEVKGEAEVATDQQRSPDLPCEGDHIVIKFHRLGRTSFRKVREKREYHQGRNTCSWLYLDRLAAKREFDMMSMLYDHGLPVPCPLANNRNAVVMSLLVDAIPLYKVLPVTLRANDSALAGALYVQAVSILTTITRQGLVHGDFNEFNLLVGGMVSSDGGESEMDTRTGTTAAEAKLILIDFPQMISRDHQTAQDIYERDLNGVVNFFRKYFNILPEDIPPNSLADVPRIGSMDVELRAPGYPHPRLQQNTKSGKRRNRLDDCELLIGTVATIGTSGDEDTDSETNTSRSETSDNEVEEVDSGDEEALLHDNSEESCSDEEGNDNVTSDVLNGDNNSFEQTRKTGSQTVISRVEVRERRKREEKKRMQNEFRLKIKRQQRATIKSKGRAEIATETRFFNI